MNRKFQRFTISALLTLVSSLALTKAAHADSQALPSPVLATIQQTAGLQWEPKPHAKIYNGTQIELLEDGKINVTVKYLKNGKEILEKSQPLVMKTEDVLRFKKSIDQLKADRPLVEDSSGPIMCDGGSTYYRVSIKGQDTTLAEVLDCNAGRIREGRSNLEVQVIKVLEDLVEAYYKTRRE